MKLLGFVVLECEHLLRVQVSEEFMRDSATHIVLLDELLVPSLNQQLARLDVVELLLRFWVIALFDLKRFILSFQKLALYRDM